MTVYSECIPHHCLARGDAVAARRWVALIGTLVER